VGAMEVTVCEGEGGVIVLVPDWQATSIMTSNIKNLFNTFFYSPIYLRLNYFKPSNRSVSTFLPPFTRLKAR
jgi:hypothetical protein